jgi:hypothetical protein
MQQGVFESNGVVVAPSIELVRTGELDGLQCAQAASGDFLSFDIQAS